MRSFHGGYTLPLSRERGGGELIALFWSGLHLPMVMQNTEILRPDDEIRFALSFE